MKKLFSPFPHVMPIALTSGHTFVVTKEPVAVPDMYVAEALSRGALEAEDEAPAPAPAPGGNPGDQQLPAGDPAPMPPTAEELAAQRADKIKEALTGMVNGSNEADFTGDGKPQLARVKAHTGFAVSRAEVDVVWAELSAKL